MNSIFVNAAGKIILDGKVFLSEPLMLLNHEVELEKGFSLRSFFRMMENYAIFTRLNAFLPDCLDQYRKHLHKEGSHVDLDFLECSKTIELIGFPNEPKLEIYTSFYGVKENRKTEISSYSLESLLDVHVKLGKLRHVIFGDKVDIFELDTNYTLFEIIDCISWHMSFQSAFESCEIRR